MYNKYFVLFGNDRHQPDLHFNACPYKFIRLATARSYAREFNNASVFRMYDNGTISEMKLYNKKEVIK